MKTNCLLWALREWKRKGGYLWIRKSDHWWGPHFGWTKGPGEPMWSFSPDKPTKRLFPPLFFEGSVKSEKSRRENKWRRKKNGKGENI